MQLAHNSQLARDHHQLGEMSSQNNDMRTDPTDQPVFARKSTNLNALPQPVGSSRKTININLYNARRPNPEIEPRQLLHEFRNADQQSRMARQRPPGLSNKAIAAMLSRKPPAAKPTTPSEPVVKSVRSPVPSWKAQDIEHESRMRAHKRDRDEGGLGEEAPPVARISARMIRTSHRSAAPTQGTRAAARTPPPPVSKKTYLGPRLTLMRDGANVFPDAEMPPTLRVPRGFATKVASAKLPAGRSAARKIDIINSLSDDDDEEEEEEEEEETEVEEAEEEDSSTESPTPSSSSSSDDELQETRIKTEEDAGIDFAGLRPFGPAELIILDTPPEITIPLPQIGPDYYERPQVVISAIESLTLPSVRMHETRQLPFLLRNLRRGFLDRCRSLKVPTEPKRKGKILVNVRYEHVDNMVHNVKLDDWRCPLCSLHGSFPTREMLKCHLDWDHNEVFVEWSSFQVREGLQWTIQILIPESLPEDLQTIQPKEEGLFLPDPESPDEESDTRMDPDISLFPFVALSPSSSPARPGTEPPTSATPVSSITLTPTPSETPDIKPFPVSPFKAKLRRQLHVPPTSSSDTGASSSQLLTPSRERSTTGTGTSSALWGSTARTRAPERRVAPDGRRYPTPPPPDDPLGPAARPPYLPAESEYGGPTVYYSCRPGGATVFDLLNTLPMEPFGVLDWAVLDREEEIFESDDVKDEYKVMHALWARWIFLNRNTFLSDFYKGTIAFVDEYWKIIHRAAGWDALRYWLLLLLANRFLTAKDVAETLKHYESLTGMAYWDD